MDSIKPMINAALILVAGALLAAAGDSATNPGDALGRAALSLKRLESRWGIQISSLRLSANGNIVDFRYKVLDPDKAAALGDPETKPFLVDQASGAKLLVPKTPKIGPLRQTAQKPETGKVYFLLFANPGRLVKSGSKVTVAIGDFRAENMTVE